MMCQLFDVSCFAQLTLETSFNFSSHFANHDIMDYHCISTRYHDIMICSTQAEPDVEMEARCYWVSTFTPHKCGSFYFMTAPQSSEVCT